MKPQTPSESVAEPGWWHNVRIRFGLLLALALLPWLVFTIVQVLTSQNRDRLSFDRTQDIIAENTVREIGLILESGRLGLVAAPRLIADYGCEAGSTRLLRRLDVYDGFFIQDLDGRITCGSPGAVLPDVITPTPFAPQTRFRIERGELDDVDRTASVVLQSLSEDGDQIYTLVLPSTLGLRKLLDVTLGEGAGLALTKPGGRAILGDDTAPEKSEAVMAEIPPDQVTFLSWTRPEGDERRIVTLHVEDLNVYVTVGRPKTFLSGLDEVATYGPILLPLAAWLIGFILIWFGTQTMLLTPIASVRRATRQFSQGKLGSRVNLSDAAAQEVQGLAGAFNTLASQLEERNTRIADNIDEKDTLMREIHHRVKNNLQIIISLLNMQERKVEAEEAISAIAETKSRINAIAIVHRGLYESADLRRIDVGPFVSRLIDSLSESLSIAEQGISVHQTVSPCQLTADSAIPVALFIVEAVSNATQHGVERGGMIKVDISKMEDGRIMVDVCDDGRGVGDPASISGIGGRLMKGFARQLSGEMHFMDNNPGLKARLILPPDEGEAQPFQVSRRSGN